MDEVVMKQTQVDKPEHIIRSASPDVLQIIQNNKSLIASLFVLCALATGIFGFTLGGFSENQSYKVSAKVNDISVLEEKIAVQDFVSLEIEKIDTKNRNFELQEENRTIVEASNTLEEKILGALMNNLDSKLLSNRSSNVNSFVQEAYNLIEMNLKIENFKKTEDYNLIDLSEYESTVKTRLARIPTLKPIPGSFPGYGWRRHPIYGYSEFHPASDQNAPHGTPIKAAGSGYVVASAFDWSRGYYIIINHGNGFTTTYMHNSANLVSTGENVNKGDVIARVGSTGISTGAHLHFEVAYNGTPFNPTTILIQ